MLVLSSEMHCDKFIHDTMDLMGFRVIHMQLLFITVTTFHYCIPSYIQSLGYFALLYCIAVTAKVSIVHDSSNLSTLYNLFLLMYKTYIRTTTNLSKFYQVRS